MGARIDLIFDVRKAHASGMATSSPGHALFSAPPSLFRPRAAHLLFRARGTFRVNLRTSLRPFAIIVLATSTWYYERSQSPTSSGFVSGLSRPEAAGQSLDQDWRYLAKTQDLVILNFSFLYT